MTDQIAAAAPMTAAAPGRTQWSPQIDKIAPALVALHAAVGKARKGSLNEHNKKSYADLSDVDDAAKGALASLNLACLQTPWAKGPEVTVETTLLHESGQWVFSSLTITATKNDPQGIGSAITYARRYAKLSMCGISADDDDGVAASEKQPSPAAQAVTSRANAPAAAPDKTLDIRVKRLLDGMAPFGIREADILKRTGLKSLVDIHDDLLTGDLAVWYTELRKQSSSKTMEKKPNG